MTLFLWIFLSIRLSPGGDIGDVVGGLFLLSLPFVISFMILIFIIQAIAKSFVKRVFSKYQSPVSILPEITLAQSEKG